MVNKDRNVLSIRGLSSRYDRIEALRGVSIEVKDGEAVAVIGANGAGKTTLLRAISGVQPISAGSVFLDGESLERTPAHKRAARGIVQVPEGRHVFSSLTVEDNLRLGGWTLNRQARADPSHLTHVYDLFPILKEKRKLRAGQLSGGQQQMLAIGRAMISRPRVLLLDEPSMGLAPIIVSQIFETLRHLKKSGMTMLVVEQNANIALTFADTAYVMETGSIVLEGASKTIANDPGVRRAYLGS